MTHHGSGNANWVVLKFGGSSISQVGNWPTIANLVRSSLEQGERPLLVVSAMSQVSNLLEDGVYATSPDYRQECMMAVRRKHIDLGESLGLDVNAILKDRFEELGTLADQLAEVAEPPPEMHARVVAMGELLSSTLASEALIRQGIDTEWVDARDILISTPGKERSRLQNFVSATCEFGPDDELADRLASGAGAVLTQGFIAANDDGDTVLLGREGSDTSAAYLAAKLRASRAEIWTDVPGMFSADPRLVTSARLLTELSFEEAQELASTGSKVLHPRSISPLRQHGIPLHIRCTHMPENPGTRIAISRTDTEPQVKGLSTRSGVTLISMQSAAMWHEVGFLADAFDRFRKHGVSVDLVSTSETNVTVTIDAAEDLHSEEVLDRLIASLEQLCRVQVVQSCAVISLVGQRIRAILPRLAPALSVFEEEKIHLVSQAANDLNLSFVIDEEQAQRLLVALHSAIIRADGGGALFGPSWEALTAGRTATTAIESPWWADRRQDLLEIATAEQSAYVYDLATVRKAANGLTALGSIDRVLYAVKANTHPEVIRELAAQGVDFDCVSPGEVNALRNLLPDFDSNRILFTPNFAPRDEYAWAIRQGLLITLDNLYPLQAWPELFDGVELLVRIDPGQGRGHHEHVMTAGAHSKFGLPLFEIDELEKLAIAANARIVGLHAHAGSGILDPDNWKSVAARLAEVAARFPDVETLDLGGGIGVPEKTGDEAFDILAFDELLSEFKRQHPQFAIWIEPGRYLVAQSGVLVSRVTQTKGKGEMMYVGIATGMNSLIRPALYGAYHEIVNLSRMDEKPEKIVTVVGPICESGDKLGTDRLLPVTREGDVILIANTGAYGRVMASSYNLRAPATELAI